MTLLRTLQDLIRGLEKAGGEVVTVGIGVTEYRFPWVEGMSPLDLRRALIDDTDITEAIRIHRDPDTNELVLSLPFDDAGAHEDDILAAIAAEEALAPARVAAAADAAAAYVPEDPSPFFSETLEAM